MKKYIKKIPFFLIIILSLIFICSTNTYALTEQSSYKNINSIQKLEVGNLSFSNILFRDYSSNSTQAIGLTGVVNNNSNNTINYVSTVYYYDANYNLIARGINSGISTPGISDFNQMSNLSILNGHSISEIKYYILSVNVSDNDLIYDSSSLTPSKNNQYNHYDYVIDKYDINILVNENNTFDIIETITTYFNFDRHGIFRTIPLRNTITRLDGTTSTNRTQVTNVNVNNEYQTSKENGNYKITIGSPYRTVIGEQTYVIKYTYNLGKDPMKNYDELYYNIIGSEWDTVIGNITFSITMPKEFDSSKLGFSSGNVGSTDNSKIKYNISGNEITGSYNGILGPEQALTMRCELPEGYFVGAGLAINIMDYILFIIPIIFLGISIFLWYKYGRDEQVVETVEFYPPEGLNSLDVGFLYKGKAENKDITSLLIFLANRGYLEISDTKIDLNSKKVNFGGKNSESTNKKIIELQNKINEERALNPNSKKIKYYENMLDVYKNINPPIDYEQYGLESSIKELNKKNKFFIRKLKDYEGNNLHERWFMDGLFKNNRELVTDKMLYNSFYKTNNKILQNANNKGNKDKIFEKTASSKRILIILMLIATCCFITIPPVLSYSPDLLFVALIFPGIGFIVLFSNLFNNSNVFNKIAILIWELLFGGIPWIGIVLPILLLDKLYLIGYIIGLVGVILMLVCLKYLPKRTRYGNAILGKIKGFKNFLETAEKDKLESLVMQNPNYFYDILPYTYVLGVSDKWIKKFETISLQAPDWYNSSSKFDVNRFGNFMNHTMSSAGSAMSSSPSSSLGGSSGGGSSGGGSSGGGSGGGGGGSW